MTNEYRQSGMSGSSAATVGVVGVRTPPKNQAGGAAKKLKGEYQTYKPV